jgi:anaerobic magnesium-protoporphyrin IX monomethyl ester cyclase
MVATQSQKRVLIINPPSGLYRRDDRCQSRVEDQTVQVIFAPVDLAYLGAMARKAGASVRIVDYPALGQGLDALVRDLHEFSPHYLVFNTTTATVSNDLHVCELAKEGIPDIVTIGKGEYLTVFGEETLGKSPSLDIIVVGEAEYTLYDIIAGKALKDVPGILCRTLTGSELPLVFRTAERPLIDDLDTLPFPARDLLNNDLYRSPETGNRLTVIYANRGCPARCIFCPAGHLSNYRLRLRSPQNIVAEIEECINQHGIHEFLFHGDTFTMNKRWVVELCQLICEKGLQIHWGCNSRVDTIDEERAEWMKRAGCWVVAFGVETGVQDLLNKMKKTTTLEQARKAIRTCRRHGLRSHAFYVIGLPWETHKTLRQTFKFASELDTDFFDINIAYPLPGTEFYDIAIREGLVQTERLHEGSYARAVARTYTLSPQELTKWRKKALLRLSLRPGYILSTLRRAGSLPVVFNYLKAAWRRLCYLLGSKRSA